MNEDRPVLVSQHVGAKEKLWETQQLESNVLRQAFEELGLLLRRVVNEDSIVHMDCQEIPPAILQILHEDAGIQQTWLVVQIQKDFAQMKVPCSARLLEPW